MKPSYLIVILILLLSFVMGYCLQHYMPEQMASHWNAYGEVDGYMPKFWGLFLMPLLSAFLFLLLALLPEADPLRKNIEKFRNHYDTFVVLIISFFFYIYILTLFWNLGKTFNLPSYMAPGFGVLLFSCGILIENARRNWTIGIKTPWTMTNDKVWKRTHKLGGKLFKLSGIISLCGIFFPTYAVVFVLVPLLISALFSFVSSYIFYLEGRSGKKFIHRRISKSLSRKAGKSSPRKSRKTISRKARPKRAHSKRSRARKSRRR
jgi:uncharacterized membrane protein